MRVKWPIVCLKLRFIFCREASPRSELVFLVMQGWSFGPYVCDAWLTLDYVASNTSGIVPKKMQYLRVSEAATKGRAREFFWTSWKVMNLLIICIDRYLSVTFPVKYRNKRKVLHAKLAMLFAWVRGGYFDIKNFLQPNFCCNLQNDINGKNLACNLHFADFWISSRICCCKLQFFIFASCILHFFADRAASVCNLQNKNLAFCIFQRRFLLGSFYYGAKFQFPPKARNLQKVDFAFCILQLFAVLSTCQLARCKNKILHFAFCIFLQICNRAKIECKHRFFAVWKEFLHF